MSPHYITPENAGKLSDAMKKGIRLAQQWPKKCGCGKVYGQYAVDNQLSWYDLPKAEGFTDEFADHEQRHCVCGSTLVIFTKIHDLSKE